MADRAAMSDRRRARPERDASVSGDDATYYVEKHVVHSVMIVE
jgi:hypothetical protein